jgi:type IV secretion system protein VirB2
MLISYLKHAGSYWVGKFNLNDDATMRFLASFLLVAIVILLSDSSFAANPTGTTAVDEVICNIVEALQGNVARGVAAFGIIFLGFSLFLGKISWGVALALGIGIGAIFGAKDIVNLIAGEGDTCAGIN